MLQEAGCSASFQAFLAPQLEQPPRAGGTQVPDTQGSIRPRRASNCCQPGTAAAWQPGLAQAPRPPLATLRHGQSRPGGHPPPRGCAAPAPWRGSAPAALADVTPGRGHGPREQHPLFEPRGPRTALGSGGCSHPGTPPACSGLCSPGGGSRSLRSKPSLAGHLGPCHRPATAGEVILGMARWQSGSLAGRAPGSPSAAPSWRRPEPLQPGTAKDLGTRQSKLRHPTEHPSKGFSRPPLFGQELLPVFVLDPSWCSEIRAAPHSTKINISLIKPVHFFRGPAFIFMRGIATCTSLLAPWAQQQDLPARAPPQHSPLAALRLRCRWPRDAATRRHESLQHRTPGGFGNRTPRQASCLPAAVPPGASPGKQRATPGESPAAAMARPEDALLPTPTSAGQSLHHGLPKTGGTSSSNHRQGRQELGLPGRSPSLCSHLSLPPGCRTVSVGAEAAPEGSTPCSNPPGPNPNRRHVPHSFPFCFTPIKTRSISADTDAS